MFVAGRLGRMQMGAFVPFYFHCPALSCGFTLLPLHFSRPYLVVRRSVYPQICLSADLFTGFTCYPSPDPPVSLSTRFPVHPFPYPPVSLAPPIFVLVSHSAGYLHTRLPFYSVVISNSRLVDVWPYRPRLCAYLTYAPLTCACSACARLTCTCLPDVRPAQGLGKVVRLALRPTMSSSTKAPNTGSGLLELPGTIPKTDHPFLARERIRPAVRSSPLPHKPHPA